MSVPFLELCARRRSVRCYADRSVEREKILRCLVAARRAPSACNGQPWSFTVVDDPPLRRQIAAAASGGVLPLNHFTQQAPVLVVVALEPTTVTARLGARVKRKDFPLMDVAIAAEHFCLQAVEEGLGTCLLGWFDEARVHELLRMPKRSRPVLIIALGYPADEARPASQRKSLEEISAWNAHPRATPTADPPRRPWLGLLGWLGLTYFAAAIGTVASAKASAFYAELARPAWAPPAGIFGPVWTLLYTLMAWAAWLVWRAGGYRAARRALWLYGSQLALNALWSWLFFVARWGAVAFFELVILIAVVATTAGAFLQIRRAAGALMLPYLVWCLFAATLAHAVWRMNPDRL